MSEKDIINLLFQPGFSTSEKVTDVSGRGVGLDVVKSKIESLSGEVEVKSKWGRGKYPDHSTASDPCNYPGTDGSRRRRKICDLSGIHPDDRRYLSQRYQTGREQRSDQLERNRDSSDPSDRGTG